MAASTSSSGTEVGKKFFSYSLLGLTVRQGMYQFYKEGKFVDCTLTASDSKSFRCHRAVLSAASPILCEALSQQKSSFASVILFDVTSSDLGLLVEYIYTGIVPVPEDRIEEFKKAGEKLKISCFGKYDELDDDAPSPSLQATPELVDTSGTSEPELMDESPAPSQSSIVSASSQSESPIVSASSQSPIFSSRSQSPMCVGLKVVLQQLNVEEHLSPTQQPSLKSPLKAAKSRKYCIKGDKVRFECQFCSKSYSRVFDQNYHQLKCDQNPKISVKCSICDTQMKPSLYNRHFKNCSAIHPAGGANDLSPQKSRAPPRRSTFVVASE